MKTLANAFAAVVVLSLMLVPAALGQGTDVDVGTDKRAQTGMKFLTVSLDPRASAMGGAILAEPRGSSVSMFYNPASMARMANKFHANLGQTQYIVDIDYNSFGVAYKPAEGQYGVFGISLINVDYGDYYRTVRADNEQGFLELGTYSPTALAAGLGYARSFADRFSVGAHFKYVYQNLGSHATSRSDGGDLQYTDYDIGSLAVDFGILYETGFRSLTIAMNVRNFSQELSYVRENFEMPLEFQIGVSMDVVNLTGFNSDLHALKLGVDAARPRDYVEHLEFGLEYIFMDILSLRSGMQQAAEEQGLSLGAGLQYDIQGLGFSADYAYTDFGIFSNVNQLAVQLYF